MSPQKIILHHLDSPIVWERDQTDRMHNRRRKWSIIAALASITVTSAVFYRGETVEDYSRHSPSLSRPEVKAESFPHADKDSWLADLGPK